MTTSSGDNGILIVGGGLAATRTAEQLRRADFTGPITIVSDEVHLPYDRPPLSKEVLRSEVDDVTLKPREFYDEKNITLRLGSAATGIDTAAQTVTLDDGSTLELRRTRHRDRPGATAHSGFSRSGGNPGAAFLRRKPGSAPARVESPPRSGGRCRIHRLRGGGQPAWTGSRGCAGRAAARAVGSGARRADRRTGGPAAPRGRRRRAHRCRSGRGAGQRACRDGGADRRHRGERRSGRGGHRLAAGHRLARGQRYRGRQRGHLRRRRPDQRAERVGSRRRRVMARPEGTPSARGTLEQRRRTGPRCGARDARAGRTGKRRRPVFLERSVRRQDPVPGRADRHRHRAHRRG